MLYHLEVVPFGVEDFHEVVSVVDEDRDAIEAGAAMEIGEKPARRLFVRGWKEPDVNQFVRRRIDSTVQPVFEAVDANHLLVDSELIRRHRGLGLEIGLVNPVVDRNVAPIDSPLLEMSTNISE